MSAAEERPEPASNAPREAASAPVASTSPATAHGSSDAPEAKPREGESVATDGAAKSSEKPRKQKAPKTVARTDTAAKVAADPAAIEVTVIVPVTTGDGRVREVVDALGSELDRLGRAHECILVFDGVRGRAWDEAQALAAERPGRVIPIAFQQPAGESTCLTAAFERARGRIVVTSPQYVQIDPYELTRMLAALDAGADFVAPWRHPRIDPVLNRVQSSLFNWVMRKIIHSPFHDLNCYFRAFRRQVLEEVAIYGDQYRFLPAIAARQGFKVVELKVRHLKEWGGTGFFGFGVYARRFLDILGVVFLSKFTLKPLRFFGTLGGVFALLGAGVCLTLFTNHVILGSKGQLLGPIFMLGVLMFVLGVQIVGFGLVGEIIIYTQARNLREYRIERVWESGKTKHDVEHAHAPRADARDAGRDLAAPSDAERAPRSDGGAGAAGGHVPRGTRAAERARADGGDPAGGDP